MGSDLCVLAMTYVCWPVTSSDTLIFGDFYLWGEVHEFRGVGRESKIFAIFLTFLSVTFFSNYSEIALTRVCSKVKPLGNIVRRCGRSAVIL